MPRTPEEITSRIAAESKRFLSFQPEVLIDFLSFADARRFLLPDATGDGWTFTDPADVAAITAQMRDYMAFGWGKVEYHRGISAGRTIDKMRAWLWLLGDDETLAVCDDEARYPKYGAPILAAISRKYEFPIPDSPEVQNMIKGRACGAGYACGCES